MSGGLKLFAIFLIGIFLSVSYVHAGWFDKKSPEEQPKPTAKDLSNPSNQPTPVGSKTARSDAEIAKNCAKRCDDKAMSKDDPVSAYEKCISECPERVQRHHKCVMACSDKCGRIKDLHRSPGEDWDSFQVRVKQAGTEIPKCLTKCAADCNREHYGE
jgi:hypothetical protein